MPACKVCGRCFAKIRDDGELCDKCEISLSRLSGYAVPVVRCKDCKHYEIHKPKVLENCERNGYIIPMKPDDFCSYGERKDGDGNG